LASTASAGPRWGTWLLILATVLGFLDTIFNYVWTGNGIHGSEGALLVVVSTLLQLIAAVLVWRVLRGWAWWLFEVLIFLDLVGTAAAAYFLEAWILLALTVIAFIGWVVHLAQPHRVALVEVAP
jgi:hypothetical protein